MFVERVEAGMSGSVGLRRLRLFEDNRLAKE